MMLPGQRFSFDHKRRRRRRIILLLTILLSIALITTAAVYGSRIIRQRKLTEREGEGGERIAELWDKKKYDEIIEYCAAALQDQPLNLQALVFSGFSYFYKGAAQFNLEDRIPLMDRAIVNLRKAMLVENQDVAGSIRYILAKAYYHKGKFYTDETILNMEESISMGYIGDDSYEYLGLAYLNLGDYPKGVENFLKAAERNPSDTLYLVLGQSYYKLNDLAKAEEYLIWTLNSTKDIILEQKSRMLLGQIYFETEKKLKAEEQYRRILELNPRSADAHYHLGEIYEALQDKVKARYEWRKALEIDPYHFGARLKLYPH